MIILCKETLSDIVLECEGNREDILLDVIRYLQENEIKVE